ncbi:MAG: transposase [Thaumarchaeota archaeon]|nr:transposase [Nitrososphaerota archaeon]
MTYQELKVFHVPSCFKLCAISKAAGILASRKKSVKRGIPTKDPYLKKLTLLSSYHFRILNENLRIPLGEGKFEEIPLTRHTLSIITNPTIKVNSFTLNASSLSLCISREVPVRSGIKQLIGIDRNLRNLTVGNETQVTYYDMSRIVRLGETTKDIIASFTRNDARIKREIASKYGSRRQERVKRILHIISKDVVEKAKENHQAIVFETIENIRSMYRKGNRQGKTYRRHMNNHWPFAEIKNQIEYKAQWQGIPVFHLTKGETRGTSLDCVKCGERLQSPVKDDVHHKRELWCNKCKKWFDRDLVAVINISRRGWLRFDHSKVQGIGSEAMVQEPNKEVVILKVDLMKLSSSNKAGTMVVKDD